MMLSFGALSFLSPWILAAFAALPVIWWLLRLTPPAPSRRRFPPIQLLLSLTNKNESPAKSPLWLLILRLLLVCAIILGAAHPVLNAGGELLGSGPLVLVIDDDWASARDWSSRRAMLENLLDRAERDRRPVAVVTTAPIAALDSAEDGGPAAVRLMRPDEARDLIASLQPKPWPTNRSGALRALWDADITRNQPPGQVVWLTNGLDEGDFAQTASRLRDFGPVSVVRDSDEKPALVLRPPGADGTALSVPVVRADAEAGGLAWIRAVAEDGRLLARQEVRFSSGETKASARFELPSELRNGLARLEIEQNETAAATVLVDERWRRRPVGLVSGESRLAEQPLTGKLFYLDRALSPSTEIRVGTIGELLKRELAVLVLADPGKIEPSERSSLETWIKKGGVAVRFAGPRLAEDESALLPVPLRQGDRIMGGSMSWEKPAKLAPFEEGGPFRGLRVPEDVTVERQVLAQPSLDLADKTWARLSDGTPLVTAEKRGDGWLVLVHTTANAAWTNLPLSGVFVEMLQRLVGLSQGVASGVSKTPLPPLETMDGYGRLRQPPATALAIPGGEADQATVNPRHPPGYYGTETARRALNLSQSLPDPEAIGALPSGVSAEAYGADREVDFKPWLLLAALLLAAADLLASLWLRRLLWLRPQATAILLLAALAAFAFPGTAAAQTSTTFGGGDGYNKAASQQTRLAYVITGDPMLDEVSYAGLRGLTAVVNRRTAAELGDPMGVSPAVDDLAFFPLLYWPLSEQQTPLSPDAAGRLNAFMRNGGTILFDTRERGNPGLGGLLPRLANGLDIPKLAPLPPDHVLTRSYYLLKETPGRYVGGSIWVERIGERINDGVSSVIVGGNDWAGAWAVDGGQRPLYTVEPGGDRQRELAYRFGINLVMYTLTGNYKADQIHVPEILKRLDR